VILKIIMSSFFFFFFFDFPAFCEEIRRVFMCLMKGSDDGFGFGFVGLSVFHVSELVVWQ
jgi:hypothetical protein